MGEMPILSGRARSYARNYASSDLIGTSAAMRRLRETVIEVAGAEATVLVTGASGTGKENVARAIHAASPRAAGPFEAVNCGAIPAELAESELFGAESGAYTGAQKARPGRIEMANGGTLFLDEIGDLPPALQVKLLRVLETREVQRLGAQKAQPVDFRLVAATNIDLDAAVAGKRFREDLYWRIAVVWLELPLLAERLEDIPALVAHFARGARGRLHLTEAGAAALFAHDWPGNLRELRNFVERALARNERLLDREAVGRLLHRRRRPVDSWIAEAGARRGPAGLAADGGPVGADSDDADSGGAELGGLELRRLLAEAEAALILQALQRSNGIVAQSARLLGLKRTTLVEKMKRMGLKAANEAA